jgi:ClpP class serine protease
MNFLDLLWVFLILSVVWPVLRQRMLDSARYRKFQELEKERGSRVIAMIHRQETLTLLGYPVARFIDIQDSEEILRAIKLTDDEVPIDLILHTPGGLILAAEQIAEALRKHPARVAVMVPHYAMSGGTLIALAAYEILMDDNAVLGPVDPQIGQYPAASILKVLDSKDINEVSDHIVILADISRKAIAQVRKTVRDIIGDRMEPEAADKFAETMATGVWTHDYPINTHEAQALGLPVRVELPKAVYALMSLYRHPAQRRPSVQYVPLPYDAPAPPANQPQNSGRPPL